MNRCVCGKTYKHQPSLIRHQRGNVKQGYVPCAIYVMSLMEEEKKVDADDLIKRFEKLETYASSTQEKAKPHDYNPTFIPPFAREELIQPIIPHDKSVSLWKIINHEKGINEVGGILAKTVIKGFKLINMNEEHPEYWNVILWNLTSSSVYVFEKGRWVDQPFVQWAEDFAKYFIAFVISESEGMDAWVECCKRCFEALSHSAKEIQTGLRSALRDPSLRTLMKARMQCNK